MELRHLRYFLAVARTEHFGRAAEQLHVAGPPLSRTIRQLEAEVGTALFTRTTRQVELTDAGRLFERETRALLAGLDDAVARARLVGEGALGVLRVGFTGSASYGVLPELARLLQRELPGVSLQIRTEMLTPDQASALVDDRLDLGVLRPPVAVEGIATRTLHSEPLVLALPAGHRLAGDPAVTVADLAHEDFVTYPPDTGSVVDGAVVRTCAASGFAPHRAYRVGETATMLALVAAGLGVALVPRSATVVNLPGAVFTELPDTESVELALAWRSGDRSPLIAAVLDVLDSHPLPTEGQAA
ncbi:LysR family transcriptional regulator [Tsukamurella soli]|uniref:LysR family transcriptional regulator n=1 Tax=Tsukamurella soli TaxID=644556 RepID=A0ABP8J061_9ACTN